MTAALISSPTAFPVLRTASPFTGMSPNRDATVGTQAWVTSVLPYSCVSSLELLLLGGP